MESTVETRQAARDILEYLKAHPENHDQGTWVSLRDTGLGYAIEPDSVNICNTTMCVAGTAAYLKHGLKIFDKGWQVANSFFEIGAETLGLNEDEADYVFYTTDDKGALKALEQIAVGDWDVELTPRL